MHAAMFAHPGHLTVIVASPFSDRTVTGWSEYSSSTRQKSGYALTKIRVTQHYIKMFEKRHKLIVVVQKKVLLLGDAYISWCSTPFRRSGSLDWCRMIVSPLSGCRRPVGYLSLMPVIPQRTGPQPDSRALAL
uniref:WD_REPEATS_REGION domain-containing protein n=1 Tax=Heterorhabditis bacteriophora TaxID=37862 RepID=A0A1I7XSD7_HETBA